MVRSASILTFVMPGLVPGIHVLRDWCEKGVDGRDKPGHDGKILGQRQNYRPVFTLVQSLLMTRCVAGSRAVMTNSFASVASSG
jgi:hypothetical protein